jgi:integrase
LRHTAASLAVSKGANLKVIQRMLGHASAAMTLDVHAGLLTTTSPQLRTSYLKLWEKCGHEGVMRQSSKLRNAVYLH